MLGFGPMRSARGFSSDSPTRTIEQQAYGPTELASLVGPLGLSHETFLLSRVGEFAGE